MPARHAFDRRRGGGGGGSLLLVYVGELPVDGTAHDELCGLDLDLSGGLVGAVRVHAAHGHQAREVGAFLLRVALLVQLAGGPAAHVARAVDGAVAVSVCMGRRRGDKHT